MYQSTTNDIIRFRCLAAHATTALDATCDSKILDKATGRLEELVSLPVVSNGTTPVTLSTAPATGKNKAVEGTRIVNLDTISHTVIVEWHNGTITRRQHTAILASGESLVYAGGDWSVYNPSGKEILVGQTGDPGTNGTNGTNGVDGQDGARGCYGNVNPSDANLVFPRIWYARDISRLEFYANGGTANVTIKKNNTDIGSAFALSSGHTTVTDFTGYTITNTSGDYYSFHWNSGTALDCSIAMIMEG